MVLMEKLDACVFGEGTAAMLEPCTVWLERWACFLLPQKEQVCSTFTDISLELYGGLWRRDHEEKGLVGWAEACWPIGSYRAVLSSGKLASVLSLAVLFCGSSIPNISRSSRGTIFFKNLPGNTELYLLLFSQRWDDIPFLIVQLRGNTPPQKGLR